MLDDRQVAAYLDGGLTAAERVAIEEALASDAVALRAVDQERIDAALRVTQAGVQRHEQVKRAILAEIGAQPLATTKARVLHAVQRPARHPRVWPWMVAAGGLAAAACWLIAVWIRPVPEKQPERFVLTTPPPEVVPIIPTPTPAVPRIAQVAPPLPKPLPTPQPPAIPEPIPQQPAATPRMIVQLAPPPRIAAVPASPATPSPLASAPKNIMTTPPREATARVETRDPYSWPFAPKSPWNQPLGASAKYEQLRLLRRENLDAKRIGLRWRPIASEDPSASVQRILVAGQDAVELPFQVLPDFGKDPEQPWCFVDREARFVTEMVGVRKTADGEITARNLQRVDLHGSGVAPDGVGVGEYGGSALGGVLRHGEAAAGIRHALTIAVTRQWLSRRGPGGHPFVWPASAAGFDARKDSTRHGNVFIGSLLAIPPNVNLDTLGVGARGSFGYALAQAMQDYGVYISGACDWQQFLFFHAEGAMPPNSDALLGRLFKELHVVTNNTAATPGGGGVPRRPLAPELSTKTGVTP